MGKRKRYRIIMELILLVMAVTIAVCLLHRHTPKVLKLLENGNVSDIESYIGNEGSKGWILLVLLQIIETVAIVIPAMPVYICAGAVFGRLKGFFICYATNVVMNVIIFYAAKNMKATTAEFAGFQKNPKLEEWMREAKHMDRLVFLMCMLPVIPNGMIPYISAQTKVTAGDFTKALAVGCIPSILIYVVCGDFLLSEHFHITLPFIIIIAVCVCVAMLFRKRITAWLEPKIKKFLG